MSCIKSPFYYRFIAYVLVSVLFIQADFLIAVTQEESLELQFQRAKTDFASQEYQIAIDRLVRLEFVYKNIPGRTSDSNRKYGETLLWLAATREVLCLDKKLVAETYKQAVDLLGKGYIVGDPGLNTLDMCRKAFNIKTPKDTTKIIEKVGQNTGKKNFPWLLVVGIVVAGVVATLLLKKKPQRILTVSVDEGVEGAPVSGTSLYKNGTFVSYSYILKTGYTGLVVKIDGNEVAASGSIKMDTNHTLTVTATKWYTLTVMRGTGIYGTPVSGSTQYNSSETVSYNYSLQSGYKDLIVKLDGLEVSPSGTIVMDKDHILTATAGKTYQLTVTKGTGVIGLPDTGTFYYKDGETLNYSYSLQTGFSDLEVKFDGVSVTPIGVIIMNRDHELIIKAMNTNSLTVGKIVGVK